MARKLVQNAQVNLTLNAKQANKMLSETEQKAKDLKKRIKELTESNGDPKMIKDLQKELRQTDNLLKQLKTEARQTSDVLSRLDKASPKELNSTLKTLQRQLNSIERGSSAWDAQMQKIKAVKAELAGVNAQMQLSTSFKDRIINFFNKWQIAIAGVTASLAGLFLAARKSVGDFAEMEEAMANTMKFCGLTKEGVRELNEEFKKLDTRTPREKLNELAQEAGRLGKNTQEDIMGYVKAADILNVALSDLGEGATQKIAKLSNIFGVEDAEGTYNAMVKIGSVVNVLSQNCTASKPYLVEFTNRLAGVGNQAGMTIQQIVGLGAVLDANAQKVEASATAIAQVLTRMYTDPAKYAKVAGLDVKQFSDLLKTDANEALLLFLETLSKAGNMDALAPMFKDMGETGSRAIAAMSTLAKHIDEVRWQQQNANKAFEEGTSVLHEYEIFNNTAQASIEKAQKSLKELTVELGEKLAPVMKHLRSSASLTLRAMNMAVDFIIKFRTEIITLGIAIVAFKTYTLAYSAAANAAASATTLWNKALDYLKGLGPVARAAIVALTNAVKFCTNGFKVSRDMIVSWGRAWRALSMTSWVGIVLAVASAVMVLVQRFRSAREEAVKAAKAQEEFRKGIRDIDDQAEEYSTKEVSRIERLYKAAITEYNSRKERLKAVESLQSLYPQYFGNIDKEIIMAGQAAAAYHNLRNSILEAARARAASELIEQNTKEILKLDRQAKDLSLQMEAARKEYSEALEKYKNAMENPVTFSPGAAFGQAQGARDLYLAAPEKQLREIEDALDDVLNKSDEYRKANEELQKEFGRSITKNVLSEVSNENLLSDGITQSGSNGSSDKEAAKAAKAAAKKAKEEFKKGLQDIKAQADDALNQSLIKYSTGQSNYLQYIEENRVAEEKYFNDSLKFYEENLSSVKGYNVEEDKDYQNLQLKKTETLQKYEAKRISYSAEAIRRQSDFEIKELENEYNWKEKKSLINEVALQEQRLQIRVKYLQQEQELYAQGTKEWEDMQIKIDQTVEDARFEKEKTFQQSKADLQKKFSQLTLQEEYEINRKVLEMLKERGAITVEQFEVMIKQLENKYKQDTDKEKKNLPGSDFSLKPSESAKKKKADYKAQKDQLDEALKNGIIPLEEYERRLKRIGRLYKENLLDPLKQCGDQWVSMLTEMYTAWDDFFANLSDGDWMGSLSNALNATVAMMGAISSQISQFTQAELQIQTKAIENRYDDEIKMAQGNARLVSHLETQKEKEIAKAKEEASKKNFEMQVIMAVAQTAANAIAAYGAGLQVGGIAGLILAPIAAATAVAAGMVQVAAIKKQQEAAAATGYAEGGYTEPGGKYEVAGVVHKGEWVASQKLLQSPVTAPVIELLDRAQKSNILPSLSLEDSNLFAGHVASSPVVVQQAPPQIVVNVPENSDQVDLSRLYSVLSRLSDRLEEPFVTFNTMTGDNGIKKAQDDLNRYMRNKNRKK